MERRPHDAVCKKGLRIWVETMLKCYSVPVSLLLSSKAVHHKKITGTKNSSVQDTDARNKIKMSRKENENSNSINPLTSAFIALKKGL
jgi:hypothetical protein